MSDPAQEVLQATFGYATFRPGQREIIEAVLAGRDCIGVMPTGAGKSLTYQIPGRILVGTTLVISPLIALMKDQVDALTDLGVRSTYINSSLTLPERRERVEQLRSGKYDLVYAAPEALEGVFLDLLTSLEINLVAVDEAHCISQWGHDFRPSYRNLAGLKGRFGGIPILALTATATEAVMEDIRRQLGMAAPLCFRGSFFRPNLHLHVYQKGHGRNTRLDILRVVRSRPGQAGIIYCLSRKAVEQVATFLQEQGVRAMPYHAGMKSELRIQSQEAFRRDDIDVIVATVAFGMGIDKSNIRYVIHRDMPKSVESYYQEIGRAGRDGLDSDCVLFYSWSEVMSYDAFSGPLSDPQLKKEVQAQTRAMFAMADRKACRHRLVVSHFGETIPPCGGSCDVCLGFDLLALTRPASTVRKSVRKNLAVATGGSIEGTALFNRLKGLRKRLADDQGLPAYIVFSDAVLLQMSALRPATPEQLLQISGVGPAKLAKYGVQFLSEIKQLNS